MTIYTLSIFLPVEDEILFCVIIFGTLYNQTHLYECLVCFFISSFDYDKLTNCTQSGLQKAIELQFSTAYPIIPHSSLFVPVVP